MRETEVHNQVCALLLNTVANAVDFELFLKAFRYTHDHVVDKGTGEAVQRTVLFVVVRTCNNNLSALHSDVHARLELLSQRALRALDRYAATVYLNLDACGNIYRFSSNSGHVIAPP